MHFETDERVIKSTTDCQNNFACLTSGSGKCSGEVADIGRNGVLILKDKCNGECAYYASRNFLNICRCPTHYALREKYQHHWKTYNTEPASI